MKTRSWFIYWLALVMVVAPVLAQSTLVEDFEDDSVNGDPSESWYTYSDLVNYDLEQIDGLGGRVTAADGEGGSQSLRTRSEGGSNDYEHAGLEFTTAHERAISFWMDSDFSVSTSIGEYCFLRFVEEGSTLNYANYANWANTGATIAEIRLRDLNGDVLLSATGGSGHTFSNMDPPITGVIDFSDDTNLTVSISDSDTTETVTVSHGSNSLALVGGLGFGGRLGGLTASNCDYDNLEVFDATIPEAPAGLEGITTDSDSDEFAIGWLLADNDPDQENGAFDYVLKADNGGGFTDIVTKKPGTAINGVMSWQGTYSASADVQFKVVALDNATGFPSPDSCIITLSSTTQDDSDSCGDEVTLIISQGGELTGPDGALFGGDKAGLAAALQVSEESLSFLMGIMLTLLIMAGGFFAGQRFGMASVMTPVSAFLGVVISYTLDLFDFWAIFIGAFIIAAVTLLIVKSRGALIGS